jgi:hypothetical protein
LKSLAFSFALLFFARCELGAATNHPKLYFNATELARLRSLRVEPDYSKIWSNITVSADWCLTKTPRTNWIAPITPDPIYENLYDRFFGIMGDLAITEHLSFAFALSGDERYGNGARRWALASCRAWQREAEGQPDSGKGYAVSRLLKGIAVAYDMAFDRFTDAERAEIRATLQRIGKLYFEKYFSTPTIAGPGFHTHHAIVEWSSFGVVALTLLGEVPEAKEWLDATVKKFEDDLLPRGLAPDGAQVEGATFWASTMHYRLFFMDPLRRVTGRDLFKKFAQSMNADLALASVASEHFPGYSYDNDDVVLEPYYGQLDYYSPVLVFMAHEYRRPIYQYLASWDHAMGQIQKTRATTPHGEQLLFELGGYSYVWYDRTVPAGIGHTALSYHFPSVDEACLRGSWAPGDLLAGVEKGRIVVHAGGRPILVTAPPEPAEDYHIQTFQTNGLSTTLTFGPATNHFELEMNGSRHVVLIRRASASDWQWTCPDPPAHHGKTLAWPKSALRVVVGEINQVEPNAVEPLFATGFNKLKMADPAPIKLTRITLRPHSGQLVIEVKRLR